MPALRRAFGDDDGGAAAAAAAVAEAEVEEEAALSPLVVVAPAPSPRGSSGEGSSKEEKKSKRRLGLFVASAALAHPEKAHYGGEDAWFCSPSSGTIGEQSSFFALFFLPPEERRPTLSRKAKESRTLSRTHTTKKNPGIADGVGGWAESGICPAEYARELMAAARSAAEGFPPARVTLESLAAARRAEAGGGAEDGPPSSSSSSGEPAGVPLACFDAAGGGAPAPSFAASSSSSSPAAASSAEASSSSPSSSSPYGEDGGASPLESLLLSSSPSSLPPSEIPKRALEAAHAAVRLPGSATACVVALDPETGTLHGVSVGDSTAVVVRNNFLLFRSTSSSHSFDCPRQLAAAPEHVEWSDGVGDGEAFEVEGLEEGTTVSSSSSSCQDSKKRKISAHLSRMFFYSSSQKTTPGDLVILGTDGVFDNCWAAELLALLPTERTKAGGGDGGGDDGGASSSSSPSLSSLSLSARDVAERVVRLAAANSRDEAYPSPYAAEAAACGVDLGGKEDDNSFGAAVSSFASKLFGGSDDEDNGGALLGGKLDDITVVVAVVGAVE